MDGVRLWIYSEEGLKKMREEAHKYAADALQKSSAKDPPALPTLEAGRRLSLFYAQKLPNLCELCGMPSEVKWTAIVYYQRFFAEHSPFEFDPLFIMFACAHVACKVEEVHAITMDKLLELSDFGTDPAVKAKVAEYELPVLEGVAFQLMVEPKPDTALQMLTEELRHALKKTTVHCSLALVELTADTWVEIATSAETLVLDLAVRSDVVLRWQASIIFMACLSDALRRHFGEADSSQVCSDVVLSAFGAKLDGELQRAAVRRMIHDILDTIQGLPPNGTVQKDAVKDVARGARRCHKAFEQLRAEAAKQDEAQRIDRKRKWTKEKRSATAQLLR